MDWMTTMVASQEKLAVGMQQKDVVKLLRKSGARRTKIDALPPSDANSSGAVYELHHGGLLIVNYLRASASEPYLVAEMSVCTNPDLPKSRRDWKTAKTIKI